MRENINRIPLSVQISGNPETGEFQVAYICIRPGQVHRTQEAIAGLAFADYDVDGKLLGIELLGFCEPDRLAEVLKDESAAVRNFLSWATPQETLIV